MEEYNIIIFNNENTNINKIFIDISSYFTNYYLNQKKSTITYLKIHNNTYSILYDNLYYINFYIISEYSILKNKLYYNNILELLIYTIYIIMIFMNM